MQKKPLIEKVRVYQDANELINLLASRKPTLTVWFSDTKPSLVQLLYGAIGKNTFRAFSGMPQPPSRIIREWEFFYFSRPTTLDTILGIQSQKEYDAWHARFCRSFARYWQSAMGEPIGFGPSTKLPNLIMKLFVLWNGLGKAERKRLIKYLHVPLDRYSLVAIRNCLPEANIPSNATMGFITDKDGYWCIQNELRRIARKARVAPIHYDVLAWNYRHFCP